MYFASSILPVKHIMKHPIHISMSNIDTYFKSVIVFQNIKSCITLQLIFMKNRNTWQATIVIKTLVNIEKQ